MSKIDPKEVGLAAMNGAKLPMDYLLDPASIAFIGASADGRRIGGIALQHMVNFGYAGKVYPVNPKYDQVFGLPCYPDIESVPCSPDLAVLSVAADQVLPILARCHAKGVRAAVVYATGFAEESAAGAELQAELERFAQSSGMLVCGPNCMGLANLNTRAITAFATTFKDYPPCGQAGNVGLVTQSGNVCAIIYIAGYERGVRFNHFINTGNEACLEYSQYLDYLAEDPGTRAAVGYVEGLRNGARFIEVAEKFRRYGKPLILLKAGDTEKGSEATLSHTAALAGNQAVNRAAFRQLGVMQARDPAQLVDLAYLASFGKRVTNLGVAVASVSGAMGAILTDLLVTAGADVPTLEAQVQEMLKARVPNIGMVANPVDMTAQIFNREGVAAQVLGALASAGQTGTILVYATGFLLDRIASELIQVASRSDRMFVVIDTGKAQSRADLEAAGIPVFTDIARASAALTIYLQWQAGFERNAHWSDLRAGLPVKSSHAARDLGVLDEHEAKQLLAGYGVPVCAEQVAHSAGEAAELAKACGYPIALKILSPDIAHKTEAGGVRLGLPDADAVRLAYADVLEKVGQAHPEASLRGVLVQKMEAGVCELIVGITRDPVFGLSMTVGLGGVFTELFQVVTHRLLPVDAGMARDMLQELRGYKLLTGFRGKPAADIDAACGAIAALSHAALSLGGAVAELEVNPLLVRPAGQGAVALDALLLTKPSSSKQ
jgi:acyl-CoA synthetase (NDP forming)